MRGITDPSALADTAGYSPDVPLERKVELLETLDVTPRLELVVAWAKDTLAELEVKESIERDVTDGMEKQQREFLLRQQLEAIRKELGEEGGADEYRAKLADLEAPDEVKDAVERELDRLDRMSEQSPEHSWIRTWLDTIFDLPWGNRSDETLDVGIARDVLDNDHTGLDDVKERVLEHLAVRKLRIERAVDDNSHGLILALIGPPGVGKTSLGESIARATGREYVRVALGGIRDEAEVRGHRRTYVGARPGRIARALQEAGTMNPVFVLDEIDKIGADWRGDPSSALLEVLDPAQNHSFRDHYLEVDFDLSEVLFVATANVLETIPGPLLDRLEVITLDGYTTDEKQIIAESHLIARQLARTGLAAEEVTLSSDAVLIVIEKYTREAGVRGLERELGRLIRRAADRYRCWENRSRRHWSRRGQRDSRPTEGRPRGCTRHWRTGRCDRPSRHRSWWRCAVHRGDAAAWRSRAHAHWSAWRRDEGVGGDRAVVSAIVRPARRNRWALSRSCSRRGCSQRRSICGHHDDDGACERAQRPTGPP